MLPASSSKRWLCVCLPLVVAISSASLRAEINPVLPDHCQVGCPLGGSEQTLYRYAYALNNNPQTKFANWVAYRISAQTQASGAKRQWKSDPDLPAEHTLEPADYKNASAALAVDRGHQANLASMAGSQNAQELNYLSNITPQKANLNKGAWEKLETYERNLARDEDVEAVYVLTGPLYEAVMDALPEADESHRVPSGYWKVLFIGDAPQQASNVAFIMGQDTPLKASFCDYQVTVDAIEKRTGLVLWSDLAAEQGAALKTTAGGLAKRFGC
ncbi:MULTISPECIES: DNA/RNA non-specific endonuclease [Pseudomonas]|uniref:DNA/RNA non-specific endonuclease n=1 Tax=Pseudomonas TaxID=286 RepID=UPI00218A1193|nr:DNA/RNA non-specific endonuclease [Pseudomonas sp. LRP2-20]BDM21239.1 DNA/RNA non-specific endonuclease [Pseudomonas sp. LRP2-20]